MKYNNKCCIEIVKVNQTAVSNAQEFKVLMKLEPCIILKKIFLYFSNSERQYSYFYKKERMLQIKLGQTCFYL